MFDINSVSFTNFYILPKFLDIFLSPILKDANYDRAILKRLQNFFELL